MLSATVTVVLLIAVVSLSSQANADQCIAGKKLLLKTTPKTVFPPAVKMLLLSKDALVTAGANGSSSDPRCIPEGGSGSGASVAVGDGANFAVLDLPCDKWTTNGAGTVYKYRDKEGTPRLAKIKAGLLKIVAPGVGFVPASPVSNGPATINVLVSVGYSDSYTMAFSGSGDGHKLLVKDATAPDTCAPTQVCGNGIREGSEECDGLDDALCPDGCHDLLSCTCVAANDPVCCPAGGSCFGQTAGECFLATGSHGNLGEVCGASGCEPAPGTPTDCCELGFLSSCTNQFNAGACAGAGGTYVFGVCSPSGACIP